MAASFNPASMTSPKPSPRQHRSTGLGSLHRLHRLRRRTASPIKRCCIMCRDLSLDLRHVRERPVPARLQFAREQPISWIGSIVLPKGAVGQRSAPLRGRGRGPRAPDPVAGPPPPRRLWRRRSRRDRPQPATHSRWRRQHADHRRRCSEGRHCPSRPGCSCSAGCRAWRLCTSASACARSGCSGSARRGARRHASARCDAGR